MKCFQHQTTDAVAVCRACGRALCEQGMKFSDYREAICSDVCHQERERVHAMRAALTVEIDAKVRIHRAMSIVYRLVLAIAFFIAIFVVFEEFFTRGGAMSTTAAVYLTTALLLICVVCEIAARITRRYAKDYRKIADRLEQ